MFGLGTTELIVIGVIVVILFGAKRIPEIGKGLGGALREFRNVKQELSGTQSKKGHEDSSSSGDGMAGKLLDQVPAVKKAMNVKEKVQRVKEVID